MTILHKDNAIAKSMEFGFQVHFYSRPHVGKKKPKHHMVHEESVAPTKSFHLTYILYQLDFDTIDNISFLMYFSKLCLHLNGLNQTKELFFFTAE